MTQVMRSREQSRQSAGKAGDRADEAVRRLLASAGRSRADASVVVALLERAADAVERHAITADLPPAERDLWESVGARFTAGAQHRHDLRLLERYADLLKRSVGGDTAMAAILGVDRSRVSQRLSEPSLYAFSAGDDRWFPCWQLIGGKPLPGIRTVLVALDPALHPLTVDHWFTTPIPDLEVGGEPTSPASWLATGGASDLVATLAFDL